MLDALTGWWKQTVWNTDVDQLSRWHRGIILLLRGLQALLGDLVAGSHNLHAMALVYKTLLSLVPLLAVMFSVLKGFGVHNELQPLLLNLMAPLGDKGVEVTDNILTFVDNTNVGALGAVGLGILLYTVISMVQQIEVAFNATWRVRRPRSFTERFSHYISVLLVGPVLIFSALGMSQTVQRHSWFQQVVTTEAGELLYNSLSVYLPFIMVVVAIAFIYVFTPNTRVRFSAALFGAVFAAILFKLASTVFTTFIVGSTKYTAIYTTFATVIILILWAYFIWLILLLGSSVAYYFQHASSLRFLQHHARLTPHNRDKLALQLMSIVVRRYYSGQEPLKLMEIAIELHVPDDIVEDLVDNLVNGGFLIETDMYGGRVQPARPPEETPVSVLLEYLRNSIGAGNTVSHLDADKGVTAVLENAETHALAAVEGINLKQLATGEVDTDGQ